MIAGRQSGSQGPLPAYYGLGVSFSAWRHHDSTLSDTVEFPFIDGWGRVLDGGAAIDLGGGVVAGTISFSNAVSAIPVDVGIQLATMDNDSYLAGFNAAGLELGRSIFFNPSTPTASATAALSLSSIGDIRSVRIVTNRKLGIDTARLDGLSAPDPVTVDAL